MNIALLIIVGMSYGLAEEPNVDSNPYQRELSNQFMPKVDVLLKTKRKDLLWTRQDQEQMGNVQVKRRIHAFTI